MQTYEVSEKVRRELSTFCKIFSSQFNHPVLRNRTFSCTIFCAYPTKSLAYTCGDLTAKIIHDTHISENL